MAKISGLRFSHMVVRFRLKTMNFRPKLKKCSVKAIQLALFGVLNETKQYNENLLLAFNLEFSLAPLSNVGPHELWNLHRKNQAHPI